MTLAINRRATALYSEERADLVLYIDGNPETIRTLWNAFRNGPWKDPFIGADGRVTFVPENKRKMRIGQEDEGEGDE